MKSSLEDGFNSILILISLSEEDLKYVHIARRSRFKGGISRNIVVVPEGVARV